MHFEYRRGNKLLLTQLFVSWSCANILISFFCQFSFFCLNKLKQFAKKKSQEPLHWFEFKFTSKFFASDWPVIEDLAFYWFLTESSWTKYWSAYCVYLGFSWLNKCIIQIPDKICLYQVWDTHHYSHWMGDFNIARLRAYWTSVCHQWKHPLTHDGLLEL